MMIKQIILFGAFLELISADTCAENTCYGRGTCYQQQVDQIVCVCQDGFTGDRCQYEKVECSKERSCLKGTCSQDHCICQDGYAGPYCEHSDNCQENPCRDHGKCIYFEDGFRCLCDKGYTSSNCENDIDECSQSPGICQNGGECINTDGSFQCQCPAGYNGQLCGYINECDSNPCLNGGRCIGLISDFRCECPTTYSGVRCEVEASDCGCVHGTCGDDQTANSCICDLGWTGYRCNEKITTCDLNPCQNGSHLSQVSTCHQYFINFSEPRIHCLCPPGLTGDFCETEINPCDNNPCRGQGDCSPAPGGNYTCDCYKGFTADNCESDIDECTQEQPCKNGGQCTNTFGSYYCECRTGYRGMNCEIDFDECAVEPCLNGGSCVDGENEYTCICQDGFTGPRCEQDIDECEYSTCPEYSVCVDKINHYRCICKPGFEGKDGCEADENECTASLCKNGGTCVDLPGDYRCECEHGYSGQTCQFDNTACGVKPCGEFGTCYLQEDINEHYCVCQEGYTGAFCDIDIDECQSSPCKNGAACLDKPNDYYCECPLEYTGKTCELDVRHCANNPCSNEGTCQASTVHPFYTCTCAQGYTGDRCQDEQLCDSRNCQHKGKCVLLDSESWRCECDRGYTGHTCATEVAVCGNLECHNGGTCGRSGCLCLPGWSGTECRSKDIGCNDRSCLNRGTCVAGRSGTFQCECPAGYEGKFCEIRSPCAVNPCQNGGSCTSNADLSYECTCTSGYSGDNCETPDLCLPNPCTASYECRVFPPQAPTQYMCCNLTSPICDFADGCPKDCEMLKNDNICQAECYNSECDADAADCSQTLAPSQDPWELCPRARECKELFNNGKCDWRCNTPQCNYDGLDCMEKEEECKYDNYCKAYYNNGLCDQGCNNSACFWDGEDCLGNTIYQDEEGVKMTVNMRCDQVLEFKSQLTYTLDYWSRAVSIINSIAPNIDEERCDLYLSFDDRYCGKNCRTTNVTAFKKYLWANLRSNGSSPRFPFQVLAIEDSEIHKPQTSPQTISTAIICIIAIIGIVLLIAAVMVGRNVLRARARLWEPDGFRTTRKRNVKDVSKMGDPLHLKTIPKLADQHNFNYFITDQKQHLMEVDLEPMYIMNRTHGRPEFGEQEETAPMITQAAFEYRQRDDTASPITQAEEQVAIGRPAVRTGLGRGETQLHAICRNKKADELKRILTQGNVDINVTDSMGRTPLYSAVGSDALEIVEILLEFEGIDLEKPITLKGSTPLILATKMVFNGIVEKLLKGGAQVNAVDTSGRTALHWAAAVSNLHAMELLLQHGSNKDAETSKKETPLFLAAREGKLEAVKMLVCNNAQRNLADSMEETPIDVARDHCHHDIEEVLLTWNTDGNTVIKQQQQHQQHPGSLTPPQSDDAATGSPNSLPTLSPCHKDAPAEEKKNKRKKKKTEQPSHQPVYQTGYWAKNQLHSPPNWMSTQMLSPESLAGSPTSIPTVVDPSISTPETQHQQQQQRLTHYPIHPGYPIDNPQSYIPNDHLLPHRPSNRQYPHHHHQTDYLPDSPEENWQCNSDWSHTSP